MNKFLGFAFSALVMLAAHQVEAQTANSESKSSSAAGAKSGSASGASVVLNQGQGGQLNNTLGGGTANYNRNDGDVTVRTTPTVYAPPVSGGNPCTLAVSGGVSVIGWGAAAGGTFVDEDCANRQKIAMIHNAGYAGVAFELMCNDKATYMAAKTAGKPCAWRAAFEPAGATAQPVAPMPPMPTPVVTAAPKQYPRCNARLGIVDNCIS